MSDVLGSFVGSSTAAGDGSDLSVPGGTTDGDIMLIFYVSHLDSISLAGWTFSSSNLIWRIADSEPGSYDIGAVEVTAALLVYHPAGSLPVGFPGWDVTQVFWKELGADATTPDDGSHTNAKTANISADVGDFSPPLDVDQDAATQSIDNFFATLHNTGGTLASGVDPSWSGLTGDTLRASIFGAPQTSANFRWSMRIADSLSGLGSASYDLSGLDTGQPSGTTNSVSALRYIPWWNFTETLLEGGVWTTVLDEVVV